MYVMDYQIYISLIFEQLKKKQKKRDMDQQDHVVLKIPTARQKLLPLFPNDNRSDIKITYKSKIFLLSKAYLRLESGYFKRICTSAITSHEIKGNYNQEAVQKILSCFYGATIVMQRNQLGIYYPIIKYLQIQSLLAFLRKDVLQFISEYDLFVVMKIAHSYSDQQIFEACLEQLEKQDFQQLKYHQFQLLQTQLSLFKLIIKAHDRHRMDGKPGISYSQINQIIRDYSDGQNLGDDGYLALKYQLISQTSLNSEEYKEIFLNQVIKMKKLTSSNIVGDYPTNQSILVNNMNNNFNGPRLQANKLSQSVIGANVVIGNKGPQMLSQNQISNSLGFSGINNQNNTSYSQIGLSNELTLQMQNTYQKKQNEELRNQNKTLSESLQSLKLITSQNQKIHEEMQRQLKILKDELKKKQQQQQEHKRTISKFQTIINNMQKQLQKKTQDIDKLVQQFQDLKKRRPLTQQQEENNMIVQSQFLPAHLIGQMMSENPKKSAQIDKNKQEKRTDTIKYEQMDEEQLQQLYLPRIKFDIQPISTPKYNLPKLCNFITSEGFSKHSLNLIYRRSLNYPAKGNNIDIRQRNNLLILISTVSGLNIGGFISVPLPKAEIDYIEDSGAFLFSLTKNQKFNIKKGEVTQAIFMSDQYLVSFANDLMISNDPLKQKSQCSWPSSYEGAKALKQRGSVWFAGQSQFLIKHLQVYEIGEEQMQMVL